MAKQKAAKIDFAKYRTPELYNAIRELIDFRGTYAKLFYQAAFATLGVVAAVVILLSRQYQTLGIWACLVLLVIGLEAAVVIGVCYAMMLFVWRSLTNMIRVVDLLLEVAKRVAKDVNEIRDGDTEMPSAKEIVQGVYLEVFLPTIEQVVADVFSIFGKPILFVYRLTFGRLMRIVIRVLPDRTLEQAIGKDLDTKSEEAFTVLEKIADNETTIVGALTWTQKMLAHVSRKIKFFVMLPCCAIFILAVVVHAFVFGGAWYLASQFLTG